MGSAYTPGDGCEEKVAVTPWLHIRSVFSPAASAASRSVRTSCAGSTYRAGTRADIRAPHVEHIHATGKELQTVPAAACHQNGMPGASRATLCVCLMTVQGSG